MEATTWKRQLGSDNLEATTWKRQLGNDNLEATTWKRQLGSDNLEATTWKRQLGSDNLEATTWKRQLGSDNLEATTWKRQLGRRGDGGGGEEERKMKIQKYKTAIVLPQSPALISVESHNTAPPPPIPLYFQRGNMEATMWKRQSGSDNLEATTCDPYRLP